MSLAINIIQQLDDGLSDELMKRLSVSTECFGMPGIKTEHSDMIWQLENSGLPEPKVENAIIFYQKAIAQFLIDSVLMCTDPQTEIISGMNAMGYHDFEWYIETHGLYCFSLKHAKNIVKMIRMLEKNAQKINVMANVNDILSKEVVDLELAMDALRDQIEKIMDEEEEVKDEIECYGEEGVGTLMVEEVIVVIDMIRKVVV
jgi:hypothetical protein